MITRTRALTLFTIIIAIAALASAQTAKRALTLDDLPRFREVRDPQLSPDGKWVAYVVAAIDVKEDKSTSQVWTVSIDGKTNRQMTAGAEGATSPRWSPDGKYLSFTSSRSGTARGAQIWLLDRSGGDAVQLTELKGRLQGYEWSPDSRRLAMVIGDPDPEADLNPQNPQNAQSSSSTSAGAEGNSPRVPKPIVIDRYKYKQDGQGYLLVGRKSYIYLFNIATKKLERLTKSQTDESSPSWSPDGLRIAFLSNRTSDPDREPANQIFIADAKADSSEKALTPTTSRARSRLEWSPDGKWLTYLEGDEKKFGAYNTDHLALIATDGTGTPARIDSVEALDRPVSSPRFSSNGKSLRFLVADNRSVYPAEVDVSGKRVTKLLSPPIVVSSWDQAGDISVVLSGSSTRYPEIQVLENSSLRQLTHHNDQLFSELQIAPTEEVGFKSKDGTEVFGLLTKPLGYTPGTRVPLLLRIHGGPNGQDAHSFSTERQIFAAKGYAVLAVNYRGSSGRGMKYSRAIFADWGHYEVEDLLAGVDHVIAMGVADPDRLGVGGWSYGGILTDYLIASDTRFKAATSGAGTAFTVAFYGTDQYIIQYDYEIGPPWNPKAWETYVKISYPFLHADRIKTPTLFLGGERDFNVPIQGGQQMYQALKSLGIDTQLVIYPNENHGITRPSYVKDRYERYLAWYEKYLKKGSEKPPVASGAASNEKKSQ